MIRVKTDGNDNNDGSTWALAKLTVGAAISAATNGDEVWVKNGLYQERITLKNGVDLYGGFAGTETSVDDRTDFPRENPDDSGCNSILDGEESGTVVTCQNTTGRFDGFTVKNGTASGVWVGASILSRMVMSWYPRM